MQQAINGWSQAASCQTNTTFQQAHCEPMPLNPIPGAMQSLAATINDLDLVLENMHTRLGDVMHPAPPRPVSGQDKAQCSMSPLVDEISIACSRLRGLSERVRDMLDRLET
jgi:hypothetical protein